MNLILMGYLITQVTDYLINHLVNFRANSVFILDEMKTKGSYI